MTFSKSKAASTAWTFLRSMSSYSERGATVQIRPASATSPRNAKKAARRRRARLSPTVVVLGIVACAAIVGCIVCMSLLLVQSNYLSSDETGVRPAGAQGEMFWKGPWRPTRDLLLSHAFVYLNSAAYRVSRGQHFEVTDDDDRWTSSCKNMSDPHCVGYEFDDFAEATLGITSLLKTTQVISEDDAKCMDAFAELQTIMSKAQASFASTRPSDKWWQHKWFPVAVDAFACLKTTTTSASFARRTANSELLPIDIEAFASQPDSTAMKAWHLVKFYFEGHQKVREPDSRRSIQTVSLYVPFLSFLVGTDFTEQHRLRSSSPLLFGPAFWGFWHTIAGRIHNIHRSTSTGSMTNEGDSTTSYLVKQAIGTLRQSLALNPCPYCRSHFWLKVAMNDQTSSGPESCEANLYPLPFLFMETTGTFEGKVASVKDGRDLVLFLSKMHNAAASSIEISMECTDEEKQELIRTSGAIGCGLAKLKDPSVKHSATWGKRRQGQLGVAAQMSFNSAGSWPWALRWRSFLGKTDSFNRLRTPANLKLLAQLQALDNERMRAGLWGKGAPKAERLVELASNISSIQAKLAQIDDSLIESGVFQQYDLVDAPTWSADNFDSATAGEPQQQPRMPKFLDQFRKAVKHMATKK